MPYKRRAPSADSFTMQVEDDAVHLEATSEDPGWPFVVKHEWEDEDENDDDYSEVVTASPVQVPQNPGRRPAIKLILTEEQEDDLAEWYQINRIFYDKGRRDYKDANLKAHLLEEKAASLDPPTTGTQLKTWIDSMRTRYVRMTDRKTSQSSPRYTAREKWVLATFSFLKEHIVKKTVRCNTLAPAVDEAVPDEATEAQQAVPARCAPRPKRQKLVAYEEEEDAHSLLEKIKAKTQGNETLMKEVLQQMRAKTPRERHVSAFMSYVEQLMLSVADNHLRGAEAAILQVVNRYIDASTRTHISKHTKTTPAQEYHDPPTTAPYPHLK